MKAFTACWPRRGLRVEYCRSTSGVASSSTMARSQRSPHSDANHRPTIILFSASMSMTGRPRSVPLVPPDAGASVRPSTQRAAGEAPANSGSLPSNQPRHAPIGAAIRRARHRAVTRTLRLDARAGAVRTARPRRPTGPKRAGRRIAGLETEFRCGARGPSRGCGKEDASPILPRKPRSRRIAACRKSRTTRPSWAAGSRASGGTPGTPGSSTSSPRPTCSSSTRCTIRAAAMTTSGIS